MYGSADAPPHPPKRPNTGRTTALVGGVLFASAALAGVEAAARAGVAGRNRPAKGGAERGVGLRGVGARGAAAAC